MENAAEQKDMTAPKVFVSYAQSMDRTEWVRQICERLIHDGVDVVADIYELPHGADIHAFMERSVNDPTITRALMFCDRLYCEKANGRLGGVGKETQIISSEVYSRIDETKFLPIFCELSDDGSPLLPTYLKSRLGIDFSSAERVEENWETLVRDLFGKPLYKKPPIGQPPAYVTTPEQPSRSGASKFLSWRQALNRNAGSTPLLFQQYLQLTINDLQKQYVTGTEASEAESALAEKLQRCAPIRDELLEAFALWSGEPPVEAAKKIAATFERLLPLKFGPDPLPSGGWPVHANESLSVFLHELYLRTAGLLLSLTAYDALALLLKRYYVVPSSERHRYGNLSGFGIFRVQSRILEQQGDRTRRYDVLADQIRERCGGNFNTFENVMEADLLLSVRSMLDESSNQWWYPHTLIYSANRVLGLFLRAEQSDEFQNVAKLLGVQNKQELQQRFLTRVEKEQRFGRLFSSSSAGPVSLRALMNLDRLDTVR